MGRSGFRVPWFAPHAPSPITLAGVWIARASARWDPTIHGSRFHVQGEPSRDRRRPHSLNQATAAWS